MANSHDASAAPPASPPIPAAADPAASAAPAHPIVHRRCHKRECPAAVPCVSRAVACLTNAHVGPSPQRQKPNEEKAEAEAGEGGQHRVSGTYGGTSSASIGGARQSSTERLPNRMVNLVISLGQASVVQSVGMQVPTTPIAQLKRALIHVGGLANVLLEHAARRRSIDAGPRVDRTTMSPAGSIEAQRMHPLWRIAISISRPTSARRPTPSFQAAPGQHPVVTRSIVAQSPIAAVVRIGEADGPTVLSAASTAGATAAQISLTATRPAAARIHHRRHTHHDVGTRHSAAAHPPELSAKSCGSTSAPMP